MCSRTKNSGTLLIDSGTLACIEYGASSPTLTPLLLLSSLEFLQHSTKQSVVCAVHNHFSANMTTQPGAAISKRRKFVADGVFYAELNEFFQRELAEEGYSGVEVRVTPTVTDISEASCPAWAYYNQKPGRC